MKKHYYITTPIYYVNDIPHIGHAYTTICCDVLARYMRLNGTEVKFLTGTDEHGQKVAKSAANNNIKPQEFVDKLSLKFRELASILNISNDDFIRTTDERHIKAVQHLWNILIEKGDIYLGKYAGWYSMRDEAFYAESELTEDGLAPTGAPVEWVEEESYFFALSKWQDKLLEFYEKNPDFIRPASRRNEIISFVKSGLIDLSVSRTSITWGVKVPGNDKHVVYVWLDALTNYISALGYPNDTEEMKKFWPADVHMVGKDITRFHAVYWPAFLMAAGIEPPKSVVAHGWWTNEGQKISKSIGNVIDPIALVEEFGLDPVRYFMMREVIFGNDGNYSRQNMIYRINNELSNKIGNLAQRTLSFIAKIDGKVPEITSDIEGNELLVFAKSLKGKFDDAMKKQNFNIMLDGINELADRANLYIDKEAPWALKKTDYNKMLEVLYVLLESIRYIAIYLQPFMPDSAGKMLDQLGVEVNRRDFASLDTRLKAGILLPAPIALFPRIVD
ncbi:MAG UNVERIFIED_CONTAM: methionine--tRNA ligase [Rickettsiaceae bacterium]